MKRLGRWLGMALLGVLLGSATAAAALALQFRAAWIRNGPWRVNAAVGSPEADMYTRALAAVAGLFALRRSEAVYFVADRDSEGRPLRTRSDYRIEGERIGGRWWSLTVYGADLFLIPNAPRRYSLGMAELEKEGNHWRAWISREERRGSWIPAGARDQGFYLVLRVYNPSPEMLDGLGRTPLPAIVREGP